MVHLQRHAIQRNTHRRYCTPSVSGSESDNNEDDSEV